MGCSCKLYAPGICKFQAPSFSTGICHSGRVDIGKGPPFQKFRGEIVAITYNNIVMGDVEIKGGLAWAVDGHMYLLK